MSWRLYKTISITTKIGGIKRFNLNTLDDLVCCSYTFSMVNYLLFRVSEVKVTCMHLSLFREVLFLFCSRNSKY